MSDRTAPSGQMSDAARVCVQAEIAAGPDETSPAYLYQQTATALRLAIADGQIDPVALARQQLAARGLSTPTARGSGSTAPRRATG